MRIVPHHLRVSLLSQRSQVRLYTYGFLHNYWRSDSLKMSDGLVNGSAREFLSRFLRDKSWAERFLSRKVWENHVYHAGGVGMRQSAEEIWESPSYQSSILRGNHLLIKRQYSYKHSYCINMSQKL